MLVYLYSDINYVLAGFSANFSVSPCPVDCSGHGTCIADTGKCQCDVDFFGVSCSEPRCPGNCSEALGHGSCVGDTCVCRAGFVGDDCSLVMPLWEWVSLPTSMSLTHSPWDTSLSTLARVEADGFLTADARWLVLFGGFSLNTFFDDTWILQLDTRTWFLAAVDPSAPRPSARHSHTLSGPLLDLSHDTLVTLNGDDSIGVLNMTFGVACGGVDAHGHVLADTWQLSLRVASSVPWDAGRAPTMSVSAIWRRLPDMPEPRAGHASVKLPDGDVLVLGGKTLAEGFAQSVLLLQTRSETWSAVDVTGAAVPPGMFGHSASLVPGRDEIAVFGGISPRPYFWSELSARVFMFNYRSYSWRIVLPAEATVPSASAYLGAAFVENLLVTYGGFVHQHWVDEHCYGDELYALDLDCNAWLPLSVRVDAPMTAPASAATRQQGRLGHILVARVVLPSQSGLAAADNTSSLEQVALTSAALSRVAGIPSSEMAVELIAVGGFSGVPRADVAAFRFPIPLATAHAANGDRILRPADVCKQLREQGACLSVAGCGWCIRNASAPVGSPLAGQCVAESGTVDPCAAGPHSDASLTLGVCTDACDVLDSCFACVSRPECGWCMSSGFCGRRVHPAPESGNVTSSGFWLPAAAVAHRPCSDDTLVQTTLQCAQTMPGTGSLSRELFYGASYALTVDQLRMQPDFPLYPAVTDRISDVSLVLLGETVGIRLRGFVTAPVTANYTFWLAADDSGELWLNSRGTDSAAAVRVASLTNFVRSGEFTQFASQRSPAMTLTAGQRYYVEALGKNGYGSGFVSIAWSFRANSDESLNVTDSVEPSRVPVPAAQLSPWLGTRCSMLSTCGACSAASGCAWCLPLRACGNLTEDVQFCGSLEPNAPVAHLVTSASQCPHCEPSWSCRQCAMNPQCEWVRSGVCRPRTATLLVVSGGVQVIFRNRSECDLPCSERTECSTCTSAALSGSCYWCESTGSCIEREAYLAVYTMGQCFGWVDTGNGARCPDCSRQTSCEDCLASTRCGWCFNASSPLREGHCVAGSLDQRDQCGAVLGSGSAGSAQLSWAYDVCPDIDECLAPPGNAPPCPVGSQCVNSATGYECVCSPGYAPASPPVLCQPICEQPCVNGECISPNTCACAWGFYGPLCETPCPCFGRSNCTETGICLSCADNSMGPSCEQCVPGFYAAPNGTPGTLSCQPCVCNGHGDARFGTCNPQTGACFCRNSTMGAQCERCRPGYFGSPENGGTCYASCDLRTVIDAVSGAVGTSGTSYEPGRTCQWVIDPDVALLAQVLGSQAVPGWNASIPWLGPGVLSNSTGFVIVLEFEQFETECSYDYVFVFDGDTTDAPLIAALSGNQLPRSIVALSGRMTLRFYSDAAVVMSGFRARFLALPWWDPMVTSLLEQGAAPMLPMGIYTSDSNASVSQSAASVLRPLPFFTWGRLPDGFHSRSGHTITFCPLMNVLAVLGGFRLGVYVAEVQFFDVPNWRWQTPSISLTVNMSLVTGPSRLSVPVMPFDQFRYRHSHTTVLVNDSASAPLWPGSLQCGHTMLVVYGGFLVTGNISSNTWILCPVNRFWARVNTTGSILALAGHGAAVVGRRMYILGGLSASHGLSSAVYYLDMQRWSWVRVRSLGGFPLVPFYAGSVVHDIARSRLILYGGVRTDFRQPYQPLPSNTVYYFYYSTSVMVIPQSRSGTIPASRFYHVAAVVGEEMLVVGGSLQNDGSTRTCYAGDLSMMDLMCNTWRTAPLPAPLPSRYGAAAAVASVQVGNETRTVLFVVGGFAGLVLQDGYALQIGPMTASPWSGAGAATAQKQFCGLWGSDSRGCGESRQCASCSGPGSSGLRCVTGPASRKSPNVTAVCGSAGASLSLSPLLDTCSTPLPCTFFTSCSSCLSEGVGCTWCPVGAQGGRCSLPSVACAVTRLVNSSECVGSSCAVSVDCRDCADRDGGCLFSSTCQTAAAVMRSRPSGASPPTCPVTCSERMSCESCLAPTDSACMWCASTGTCSSFTAYIGSQGFGQCLAWSLTPSECPRPCSALKTCRECSVQSLCGWCAGENGGICLDGGPEGPFKAGLCDAPMRWAYERCPDVDECTLGLHDCPMNASCVNKEVGFGCVCDAGFTGDGYVCDPVCDMSCVNGACSAPNVCSCHVGWSGPTCGVDCGCNGHSYCNVEVGRCDACLHNTQGDTCAQCAEGYYGDATAGKQCISCRVLCNGNSGDCEVDPPRCFSCGNHTTGQLCESCESGYTRAGASETGYCRPCFCNGHSESCDDVVGTCSQCRDRTAGLYCEECMVPFLGDAEGGGLCYSVSAQEDAGERLVFSQHEDVIALALSPRYTNLVTRVVVDVQYGEIEVFIGTDQYAVRRVDDSDGVLEGTRRLLVVDAGRLYFQSTVLDQRKDVVIRSTGAPQMLYVVLHLSASYESAALFVYFVQAAVNFDVFVFLSVFLSCLIMLLQMIMAVWRVHARRRLLRRLQERQMELESLAHRPVGSTAVLLGAKYRSASDAPAPLAVQELRKSGVLQCSFLVEQPASLMMLGTGLFVVRKPEPRVLRRLMGRRRPAGEVPGSGEATESTGIDMQVFLRDDCEEEGEESTV
jgi:multipile epidermal growth factor-like domains protein 8